MVDESARQRKRRERAAAREAAGLGYRVTPMGEGPMAGPLYRGDRLDEHAPGEHVWIVAATFITSAEQIERMHANPQDEMILMDREALALVTGPGCWVCEEPYTRALAAQPCPGDPSESIKRGERR